MCVLIPDIALSPQPSATEVCARWRRLIKQSNFIYIVHFKNRGNSTCFTHTDEKDYKKTERLTASQRTLTQTTSFRNSKLVFALTATCSAFLMTLDQDDEQWSAWPTAGGANRIAGVEVSFNCKKDVHMKMHMHMLKKFCRTSTS